MHPELIEFLQMRCLSSVAINHSGWPSQATIGLQGQAAVTNQSLLVISMYAVIRVVEKLVEN